MTVKNLLADTLAAIYGPKKRLLEQMGADPANETRLLDAARGGDKQASNQWAREQMQNPFMGLGVGNIKAFHGSPHSFTQFSNKNIGTGEGAQAYGHGLYFADNPNIARHYRDALVDRRGTRAVTFADDSTTELPNWLAFKIKKADGSIDGQGLKEALDDFRGRVKETQAKIDAKQGQYWNDETNLPGLQKIVSDLERVQVQGGKVGPAGHLYEVNLKPDPPDFLDWDKPLSQQSEKVRAALEKMGISTKDSGSWSVRETSKGRWTVYNVWGEASGTFKDRATAQAKATAGTSGHHTGAGALVYQRLGGNAAYSHLDKGEASRKLRDAGIRGIRYKDAGSRGKEAGTNNYVLFDDADVEILSRK